MISVMSIYIALNWVFYLGAFGQVVVTLVGLILFLFLTNKNVKRLVQQRGKQYTCYFLVPIGFLTLLGAVFLLLIIRLIGNTCEGFGRVLTINQGWQVCPENLIASFMGGIIALMCFFIFFIVSIGAYSLCNKK